MPGPQPLLVSYRRYCRLQAAQARYGEAPCRVLATLGRRRTLMGGARHFAVPIEQKQKSGHTQHPLHLDGAPIYFVRRIYDDYLLGPTQAHTPQPTAQSGCSCRPAGVMASRRWLPLLLALLGQPTAVVASDHSSEPGRYGDCRGQDCARWIEQAAYDAGSAAAARLVGRALGQGAELTVPFAPLASSPLLLREQSGPMHCEPRWRQPCGRIRPHVPNSSSSSSSSSSR